MPYLAFISVTSLNYAPIISGSSCSILCLSLARLNAILSSSKRVTNLLAQFLPTSSPPRIPSSLSAISATLHSRGANPRASRSRIYWIIVCSSVSVSLRPLGTRSRINSTPLTRLERIRCLTLKARAVARWL
jgi:hypothetical protein